MDRSEKVTLTNMCMVYNDKGEVLVQNRIKESWGGLCFPGGHIEKNESLVTSTIREVYEETGLKITNLHLCGTKEFIDKHDNRYLVFLYKTHHFDGILQGSAEGEVFWISPDKMTEYNLTPNFLELMDIFINPSISEMSWEDNQWIFR